MTTIKAPFNFVPLSEKVYFPDWAADISHDIPFENQLSGQLELEIKVQTPLFVRNGHTKEEAEQAKTICEELMAEAGKNRELFFNLLKERLQSKSNEYFLFSRVCGKSFIPATSIKGAIRNVLEIMSFGKIHLDENAMFAQREWDDGERGDKTLYTLKKEQNNLRCGWLRLVGDKYQLLDCGKPYRIGHNRIDEYAGEKIFANNFSKNSGVDLNKEVVLNGKKFDPKTAIYKYELLKNRNINLEDIYFEEDADFSNNYGRKAVKVKTNGPIKGSIVFTGQPDKWKWKRPKELDSKAGKFYEFVFEEVQGKVVEISQENFNHFKFIYDQQWDYLKTRLSTPKGIPVFFRMRGEQIKDWGIAYLYKLPYTDSPYSLLKKGKYNAHVNTDPDLAECIFGYINKDRSLKGRVQFSNAYYENNEVGLKNNTLLTLGSPKASYYPIYIQQEGANGKVNNYKTYNDGMISGWKRYPVRKQAKAIALDNATIDSVLFPADEGDIFKGKMRFYNLKEIELGALLSALTFHNSSGCYHQLGQGKPYGYGKVTISCRFDDPNLEKRKVELMSKFEKEISSKLKISWHNAPQIQELFTMAHHEVSADEVLFDYMHMDTNGNLNEFSKAKREKEFLDLYTRLKKETYTPDCLTIEYHKELQKIEKEKEEKEKFLVNQNIENLLDEANRICDIVEEYKNEIDKGIEIYTELVTRISEIDCLEKISSDLVVRRSDIIGKIHKKIELLNSWKKYASPLEDSLRNISNIKTVLGNTKKWRTMNSFSPSDLDFLKKKFSEIYSALKPRDQKEWKNKGKWKDLGELIGEENAQEWLKDILK